MPTYNHEFFIAECLDSILSQADDLEIVVGDDCSTDNTAKVIEQYFKKYPDIIVPIFNKKNLGMIVNFNNILERCRGKYIIMLSGDDMMLPGSISKLVNFMDNNPDHAMCIHDLEVFDSATGRKICYFSDISQPPSKKVESLFKPGVSFIVPGAIIRKDCIPESKFNQNIPTISDWLLLIEIATQGYIGYIPEVLARYRRHIGNTSNKRSYYGEYFIGLGILRSKYPRLIRSISYYEGFVFFGFMVNFFRINELDLAFTYAKESLLRGYKIYLTLPVCLLGVFRLPLIKKYVDQFIKKVFFIVEKIVMKRRVNYKLYQQSE